MFKFTPSFRLRGPIDQGRTDRSERGIRLRYSRQQASQPRSTHSSTASVAVRDVSRFTALLRPQGMYEFHRCRRSCSGSVLLFARLIVICIRRRAYGTIRISVRDLLVLGQRCIARRRTCIINGRREGRILRLGNLHDIIFLRRGTRGWPVDRLDSKVSVIVEIIIVLRKQHTKSTVNIIDIYQRYPKQFIQRNTFVESSRI